MITESAMEDTTSCRMALELERRSQILTSMNQKYVGLAKVEDVLTAANERKLGPRILLESSEFPRLNPNRQLNYISNIDDLLFLFVRVLQGTGSGSELEILLNGVLARGCNLPEDFCERARPLVNKARKILSPPQQRVSGQRLPLPFAGASELEDLAALAIAWVEGLLLSPAETRMEEQGAWEYTSPWASWTWYKHQGSNLMRFFSARVYAIAVTSLQRVSLPCLATPTHGDWIDPVELPGRIRIWQDSNCNVHTPDVVQCFLRLAPERRELALADCQDLHGEIADATKYALGGVVADCMTTPIIWLAAEYARMNVWQSGRPGEDEALVDGGRGLV